MILCCSLRSQKREGHCDEKETLHRWKTIRSFYVVIPSYIGIYIYTEDTYIIIHMQKHVHAYIIYNHIQKIVIVKI